MQEVTPFTHGLTKRRWVGYRGLLQCSGDMAGRFPPAYHSTLQFRVGNAKFVIFTYSILYMYLRNAFSYTNFRLMLHTNEITLSAIRFCHSNLLFDLCAKCDG